VAIDIPLAVGSAPGRRAIRFGLMPTLPLVILIVMVVLAVGAPFLTPYDPVKSNLRSALLPPFFVEGGSMAHPLGTDGFGRDILSRVLFGARVSLSVAVLALVIATTIGTVLGVISGWVGGWLDSLIMRFVDMVLAVPTILVALALAIALGPSFVMMVTVIGLLIWPRIARILRGETLLIRQQDYVRYARVVGVPPLLSMLRHVLPNVMPTLLVVTTLEIGHVILVESSLSFLGAGIPPPQPSWGAMISDGRALIATGWWIALFPGLAIVLTVMVFNTLGDWLRDHFDPRLRDV
jgi:peptide/nickel transport system permease protein